MKDFKTVTFTDTNGQNELLIALLSDQDFDSFEELDDNALKAYISQENYNKDSLSLFLASLPSLSDIKYTVEDLPTKNWNEEWEKNFEAIHIGDRCTVRAPFHAKSDAKYDLVIEPKMAFGTGHHATTEMVLTMMLDQDFNNKEVLDFGCGTGILSLLAQMKGATRIDANDVEEPAFENTKENARLNNCDKINALYGDFGIVPQHIYDIVLANVTADILQENLPKLNEVLKANGHIYLSGILPEQQHQIEDLAQSLNLAKVASKEQNNWVALHYQKV